MLDRKKKNIVELTRCSVEEYRGMSKLPLMLLTDNVRSMHNIGSLFRTSDAFRVSEILLGGISGCPPHPEISKTALGAEESVRWRHVEDSYQEARNLQAQGWRVCVLEQTHNSIMLQDFNINFDEERGEREGEDTQGKYILVVGNEVEGVDQRIVDIADYILEIPQEGTKHSLNVSASAAIALFQLYIQLKH
ncbi:MAG: TrmH family RNA methyltransferase [Lepagella sp.]